MISQSNFYFKQLLEHLSNVSSLNAQLKNDYWLSQYEKLADNSSDIIDLPTLMPLIYPEFLYNSNGEFIGDFVQFNANSFNYGINLSDDCQFGQIHRNGHCEFNHYKSIRGKCQADHYWPHSLGGPTILENRVLLCKFHNTAKSNSILNDFWEEYPSWINDYLNRMYNLKQ
jgi:hypothetical protein